MPSTGYFCAGGMACCQVHGSCTVSNTGILGLEDTLWLLFDLSPAYASLTIHPSGSRDLTMCSPNGVVGWIGGKYTGVSPSAGRHKVYMPTQEKMSSYFTNKLWTRRVLWDRRAVLSWVTWSIREEEKTDNWQRNSCRPLYSQEQL